VGDNGKVTVFIRDSALVGRVVVEKYRGDGAKGLTDDVPIAMLRALSEHWAALGWSVVDERIRRTPSSPPAPSREVGE